MSDHCAENNDSYWKRGTGTGTNTVANLQLPVTWLPKYLGSSLVLTFACINDRYQRVRVKIILIALTSAAVGSNSRNCGNESCLYMRRL